MLFACQLLIHFEKPRHNLGLGDILGLDAKDFMESCENWEKEYKEIWRRFVGGFNTCANYARIGNYPGTEYTMFIQPTRVSSSGSEVFGWMQVINSHGEIIFRQQFHTEQGRIGSVTNLMGDALEKYGQQLGRKF